MGSRCHNLVQRQEESRHRSPVTSGPIHSAARREVLPCSPSSQTRPSDRSIMGQCGLEHPCKTRSFPIPVSPGCATLPETRLLQRRGGGARLRGPNAQLAHIKFETRVQTQVRPSDATWLGRFGLAVRVRCARSVSKVRGMHTPVHTRPATSDTACRGSFSRRGLTTVAHTSQFGGTKIQPNASRRARPLLAAAELIDLNGGDPGLKVGVNARHACTSRAVAQEADHIDYLTYRGKLLAAVLVELVDGIRVLQGEPHAVIAPRLDHQRRYPGPSFLAARFSARRSLSDC
jgi:hypothetical protein